MFLGAHLHGTPCNPHTHYLHPSSPARCSLEHPLRRTITLPATTHRRILRWHLYESRLPRLSQFRVHDVVSIMPGSSIIIILCCSPLKRLDGAEGGDEAHDGKGEKVKDVQG